MFEIFIGIDLAWGEKNPSGFCVLAYENDSLILKEIKLLQSIDEILQNIELYKEHKVYVGVDAPLVIPNETGNREIEKAFNKDFSKYKVSMLPVNRTLMSKYSPSIRSEVLFKELEKLGFKRDYEHKKVVFEVYPHATIAVCFNEYKILPYKRKKGRNTDFIKTQLEIYKNYLSEVVESHDFLDRDVALLKGKSLKDYEDQLDAMTSAYTLFYCKNHAHKLYKLENQNTFVSPI